ncbi:MAG TPA: hypothetical protein DDX40_09780 [Rikenellaceae bacterium]|nr:hypothetical protein [Rikenellaceae bacterium]
MDSITDKALSGLVQTVRSTRFIARSVTSSAQEGNAERAVAKAMILLNIRDVLMLRKYQLIQRMGCNWRLQSGNRWLRKYAKEVTSTGSVAGYWFRDRRNWSLSLSK